jgi:hypothetical protein
MLEKKKCRITASNYSLNVLNLMIIVLKMWLTGNAVLRIK